MKKKIRKRLHLRTKWEAKYNIPSLPSGTQTNEKLRHLYVPSSIGYNPS